MRKFNFILIVLIVGILLVPGPVIGKIAEACCGVNPYDLVVTDEPDPACVGGEVTLSGSYATDVLVAGEYDTGIHVTIVDPDGNTIVDEDVTLAEAETEPGTFPFTYTFDADSVGQYAYQVSAWAYAYEWGWGRMDSSAVSGTVDVEECMEIDIKPGSDPNSINPKGKGVIPVAILTTDTFDAASVDPGSVTFGPTGTEASPDKWAMEDVDGDGDIDMILHFKSQDCGFSAGDETGILVSDQGSGSDSVNIVPKSK